MTARRTDDIGDHIIAPDGQPRSYDIGYHCGEIFVDGDDYDGLAITIEIHSEQEGHAIAALLDAHATPAPPDPAMSCADVSAASAVGRTPK